MNGERIKLARKRAGLSLRDLAKEMNGIVSAQAIGKYERGEMTPSSDVLSALSRALGVSLYYLSAPQEIKLEAVEFRSLAGITAKDRARVATEVIEWVERYLQVEEILSLKSAEWFPPKGMPRRIESLDEAEALANELRKAWKLGIDPIPNMTELLEERGIKVLLADLPKKVSGFTCMVKRPAYADETPVIVVNRALTLERRRFTMAHELGHRMIDSNGGGDVEKLCHRFAGAFLVNREHLMQIIGERRSAFGVREITDLKRLYRISASAFLVRLEQAGAMRRTSMEYAFRTYGKTWRSTEPEALEPPEKQGESEQPERFERLVYRAAAEDLISVSKAVELLRLPLNDVEKGLKGPAEAYADNRKRQLIAH